MRPSVIACQRLFSRTPPWSSTCLYNPSFSIVLSFYLCSRKQSTHSAPSPFLELRPSFQSQANPTLQLSEPSGQPLQIGGEVSHDSYTADEADLLPVKTRYEEIQLRERLKHLLDIDHGPFGWRWTLTPDKKSLTKSFAFKTDLSSQKFTRFVYAYTAKRRYKLDLSKIQTTVIVYTLSRDYHGEQIGIHKRDLSIAETCDKIAELIKEEEETYEEKKIRLSKVEAKLREYVGYPKELEEYDSGLKIIQEPPLKNYFIKRLLNTLGQENVVRDEIVPGEAASQVKKERNTSDEEKLESEPNTSLKRDGVLQSYKDPLGQNVEEQGAEKARWKVRITEEKEVRNEGRNEVGSGPGHKVENEGADKEKRKDEEKDKGKVKEERRERMKRRKREKRQAKKEGKRKEKIEKGEEKKEMIAREEEEREVKKKKWREREDKIITKRVREMIREEVEEEMKTGTGRMLSQRKGGIVKGKSSDGQFTKNIDETQTLKITRQLGGRKPAKKPKKE